MMTSETTPRGFPWGLTLAAGMVFVVLCGLGTWQVRRLAWKRDLIAHVDALSHAPARPLEVVLAKAKAGEDVSWTRVRARCLGLATAPFVRLYALSDGRIGDRLLSPCRSADGAAPILVDRGFLAQGAGAPRVEASGAAPVEIVGVLRRPDPVTAFTPVRQPDGRWFARDLAAMGRDLAVTPQTTYYLAAETSANPETPALTATALPPNISNRHLGYVITWYGLAAALGGVYVAFLRKRLARSSVR
jgi:surfeit locus 1 family protein